MVLSMGYQSRDSESEDPYGQSVLEEVKIWALKPILWQSRRLGKPFSCVSGYAEFTYPITISTFLHPALCLEPAWTISRGSHALWLLIQLG